MPIRHYLSEIIGDGLTPATAFRPAIADIVPQGLTLVDARADETLASGWYLVEVDVTTQQHNAARANVKVLPLPFEEAGTGRVLDLDEATDLMGTVDRDRVISRLEAIGVALHDFVGKTKRQVLRRIVRRLILRRWLGAQDFPAGLDTTWGQLSAARRSAIRDVMTAHGVDMSIVNGPDTIRAVQHKIIDQDIPALRTRYDAPAVTG